MIKAEKYLSIDKVILRQKGWKLFSLVIGLQVIFLFMNYVFKI